MQPIFEARCNCLYAFDALAPKKLEAISGRLGALGVFVDPKTISANVQRFGNWVGGDVAVFPDRLVFSMNAMNAAFQEDTSDLVIPTALIEQVAFGRMLLIAKTVDCTLMGTTLRFRCNGRANDRLLQAIASVIGDDAG